MGRLYLVKLYHRPSYIRFLRLLLQPSLAHARAVHRFKWTLGPGLYRYRGNVLCTDEHCSVRSAAQLQAVRRLGRLLERADVPIRRIGGR